MIVVWTERARDRLAEIEEYVYARNPRAAMRLVDRLIARGFSLARFPRRGRPFREIPGSALRELVDGNYRLVYRIHSGEVQVLTVFEGHRTPPWDDLEP